MLVLVLTKILELVFDGTNAVLQNVTGDSDIVFKGKDDTSIITALTLDMSAAGAATFNSNVTSNAALIATSGVYTNLTVLFTVTTQAYN